MEKILVAIDGVEVATVGVDVPNTIGQHGPYYPTLRVMLNCTLLPYRPYGSPTLPVTMLQVRGLLVFETGRIAECQIAPNVYSDRLESPNKQLIAVELPLDAFRIGRIEDRRDGDFSASLHWEFLFAVHTASTRFVKVEPSDLRLELPQSHWTSKVLPGLGYHSVGIIELPFPAAFVEPFLNGAAELRRAVDHFRDGTAARGCRVMQGCY